MAQILFSQGFGTRRVCAGLVQAGLVSWAGRTLDDPALVLPLDGLVLRVDGADWPYHAWALVMLHKPTGYECSRKPRHHPGVLSLLPAPLRMRDVQPIGRLDEDTTGLLLLTDDGALIHRLTSPRHHVPKVYEVVCTQAVTADQVQRLLDGVLLHDEHGGASVPVRAAACVATGVNSLTLTLTEGKYHQVKRMVAAVGNRVQTLHRSRFGALALPPDLPPGAWRWIDATDTTALFGP